MSGVKRRGKDLRSFTKGLQQLPRKVAIATAAKSATGLTAALTGSFDSGRTAYDEPRPLGSSGKLDLVESGRLRQLLRFVYDGGTKLRASIMALSYARYLIRFGVLPRGGDPLPGAWQRLLDANTKAAGNEEAAQL